MIALRNWQEARRKETVERVKSAIKSLLDDGLEVNFSSVSKRSGVARKTLYVVGELKELVLEQRIEKDIELEQIQRIAELEKEVKRLKDALFVIRSMVP